MVHLYRSARRVSGHFAVLEGCYGRVGTFWGNFFCWMTGLLGAFHYWTPFQGTYLLMFSIGRGLGALKGVKTTIAVVSFPSFFSSRFVISLGHDVVHRGGRTFAIEPHERKCERKRSTSMCH